MSGHKQSISGKMPLVVGIGLIGLVLVGVTLASVFPNASNQGYAPEQPIPFNHKKHATLYKMDCQYCHVGAEKSRHASVPGVGLCMNCHSVVKTESPWIQKIKKHFDEGTPIEWVRIHELPDHVHFPHNRHMAAGLACQNCHGDVQNMERLYQHGALDMGWCLDCHRGKTTPPEVKKKMGTDEQGNVAPIQCSTCHY